MAVTVTLQQIRDKSPCRDGWDKVLASRGHDPDYNEPFPLADIIASNCLSHAVWALRCLDSPRISRQYALDCANMIRLMMRDERSTDALDVAAKYLSGEATIAELLVARRAAADAADAAASAYADDDAAAYTDVAYAAAAAAAYAAAYSDDDAADAAADAYAAYADAADDDAADDARKTITARQESRLRELLDQPGT